MRRRKDKRVDKERILGEASGKWGGGGRRERSVRSYHQVRWPELRGSKKKDKKKKRKKEKKRRAKPRFTNPLPPRLPSSF